MKQKRHLFHYYHVQFWKELVVVMCILGLLFAWDYYTTPPSLRGWKPTENFYGSMISKGLKGQIIGKTSKELCLLDSNEDGIHDLKDENLPTFTNKNIAITWVKHEYQKIEIRSEAGLSWNDVLATGYRYEVPLKSRHLFQPGVYTYRLINPYNSECQNLVGRFRVNAPE